MPPKKNIGKILTAPIKKSPGNTFTANKKGELIQVDLFFFEGHSRVFLLLIDTFSRYVKVVPLKSKKDSDKIFVSIREFIKELNIPIKRTVKILSDEGTEWIKVKERTDRHHTYHKQPIKWIYSKSVYKAAMAEANIGVFKRLFLLFKLNSKASDAKMFHNIDTIIKAITKKMNSTPKQTNNRLIPFDAIKKDFSEEDFIKKTIVIPDVIPHPVGAICIRRNTEKKIGKLGLKKSLTPNFDSSLMIIAQRRITPSGAYRYSCKHIFDKYFDFYTYAHNEIQVLEDEEIDQLLPN